MSSRQVNGFGDSDLGTQDLGGDLTEGYSRVRSQVSADPSPSMWRASSSLNLEP